MEQFGLYRYHCYQQSVSVIFCGVGIDSRHPSFFRGVGIGSRYPSLFVVSLSEVGIRHFSWCWYSSFFVMSVSAVGIRHFFVVSVSDRLNLVDALPIFHFVVTNSCTNITKKYMHDMNTLLSIGLTNQLMNFHNIFNYFLLSGSLILMAYYKLFIKESNYHHKTCSHK